MPSPPRLLAFTKSQPRRCVADFVQSVPARLVAPLFEAAQVDSQVKGAYLGQKERNRLVATLKGWPLDGCAMSPWSAARWLKAACPSMT